MYALALLYFTPMSGAIEETCEYVIFGDGLAELALGTFLNIQGRRTAVIKSN